MGGKTEKKKQKQKLLGMDNSVVIASIEGHGWRW